MAINPHQPNLTLMRLGISRERVVELCARMHPENRERYDRACVQVMNARAIVFVRTLKPKGEN